jgi:hypothetical protein
MYRMWLCLLEGNILNRRPMAWIVKFLRESRQSFSTHLFSAKALSYRARSSGVVPRTASASERDLRNRLCSPAWCLSTAGIITLPQPSVSLTQLPTINATNHTVPPNTFFQGENANILENKVIPHADATCTTIFTPQWPPMRQTRSRAGGFLYVTTRSRPSPHLNKHLFSCGSHHTQPPTRVNQHATTAHPGSCAL